jgi:hypothetical protein
MKRFMLFAILGIFFAAFALAQSDQPTQQQPGAYPEQKPMTESKQMSSDKISGTVDKVDLTGKSFTVKLESGEPRTFTFDDKTKWEAKDNKMFGSDQLKVGDKIHIEADASNLAKRIKLAPASETPKQ